MALPIEPPFKPMLAKTKDSIPESPDMLYEPKWDGFRCVLFRNGDQITLGSRNTKPLNRYFPELMEPIKRDLPNRCVLDGEIVIATPTGLDFDALGQRIHPAESRIARLAEETPSSFVAFDMLAFEDNDITTLGFADRRALLERALADCSAPIYLTPATADVELAQSWFERFEGAGFDGVIAKPGGDPYVSDKRTIWKIKHQRTADVVLAGYRMHKDGEGAGSLLLGLYDNDGTLHNIGVATGFSVKRRAELIDEVADLVLQPGEQHPWHEWADAEAHEGGQRMPGAPSRWNGKKDQSWVPLRCERVIEIGYSALSGMRLRHPSKMIRWRPDRDPESCRYDQLDEAPPAELFDIFTS